MVMASLISKPPGVVPSLIVGLLMRALLMLYGLWQDSTMVVKYTDVDYYVFTDAAKFVTEGESPYRRATYRYTPVLAWLLTPNIYVGQLFGKTLFILCDVAVGYLIFAILRLRSCKTGTAVFCAQLWLLNPLPATVSSRGNAESIIALLVLGTLYCLAKGGLQNQLCAFCLYAASVHMKIYPVTYSLPIYLFLENVGSEQKEQCTSLLLKWIVPNKKQMVYILCAAAVFVSLTGICYVMYGDEFVQETYLYHVTRRDTRHNFSPYFYLLYLTRESSHSVILGLLAFLPQAFLLIVVSFKYYRDLPFCCFLQTFIFVTFNKVCTSQYFLWYLSLLPLVVPQLTIKWTHTILLVLGWFAGQALWLSPAYYLEFEGQQTFLYIWLAGLVFFLINTGILYKILTSYTYVPLFENGQRLQMPQRDLSTVEELLFGKHGKKLKPKSS